MQILSIVTLILKVLRERHRQCWILTLILFCGYWPPHTAEAVGRRGEKRMKTWFRCSWYHREWPAGTFCLGEAHRERGRDGVHKKWHNRWSKVWDRGGHRGWRGSLKWDVVGDGKPAEKSLCLQVVSVMEVDYYYHNVAEKRGEKAAPWRRKWVSLQQGILSL